MKLLAYTWGDFDRIIGALAYSIGKRCRPELTNLYGKPVHGLPLVAALAGRLDLRILTHLNDIEPSTLHVDALWWRGAIRAKTWYSATWAAVDLDVPPPEDLIFVERIPVDRWAVWPWQSIDQAATELQAWELRRRKFGVVAT